MVIHWGEDHWTGMVVNVWVLVFIFLDSIFINLFKQLNFSWDKKKELMQAIVYNVETIEFYIN